MDSGADDETGGGFVSTREKDLQCHSMKCVCRMLETEYNEVANKQVPNTQAGWGQDRMATELR
eukprot:6214335-Pleurochrysis_carterae.AAC.2